MQIADIEPEVFAERHRFLAEPADAGQRLDKVLARHAERLGLALSRTRLQNLVAGGHVGLDGAPVSDPSLKLRAGAELMLTVPAPREAVPRAETMALDIMFEDASLLVLDKPAGLVVHPAAGHGSGTLVNALLAHCGDSLSGIGGVKRPGIVHRLDRDTTGLMVVAKTDRAHQGLAEIFADHGRSGSLEREYLAFVWMVPDRPGGSIDAPLGRHPHHREKMAVVEADKGRHALTHWRLEERFGHSAALLRCRLETGRTHQIRVHLTEIGHPLIGDGVYGGGFLTKAKTLEEPARSRAQTLGRQALHAAVLGFEHPVTAETLRFESPLPADLAMLAEALRHSAVAAKR